jgi:hypothetical protein
MLDPSALPRAARVHLETLETHAREHAALRACGPNTFVQLQADPTHPNGTPLGVDVPVRFVAPAGVTYTVRLRGGQLEVAVSGVASLARLAICPKAVHTIQVGPVNPDPRGEA